MEAFYRRVKKYVLEKGMVHPGEAVTAGVSGGADSVCLLLVLERMARELPFFLQVVHVHHGLRESAMGDQEFVEELCRQKKLPCQVVKTDAAAAAAGWGVGVEEAGRRIRYEAFARACGDLEARRRVTCRIAVAHHREDQAETVLFHLCRGTGLRGARGMLPVSGRIIRPLLEESRSSIEDFLSGKGMTWREDETNCDISYARNYLRAEIFPRLEEGVNPAAARRIAQFACECAGAERYIEAMTDQAFSRCVRIWEGGGFSRDGAGDPPRIQAVPEPCEGFGTDGGNKLPELPAGMQAALSLPAFLREDPYIQNRILCRCLALCAGSRKDLGLVHIEALRKLCDPGDGRERTLSMPGGVTACRTGESFFFFDGKLSAEERRLAEGEGYPSSEKSYSCRILLFDGDMGSIPQNQYTKWFDYDKMEMFPVFRTRQPGDCMTLLSGNKPGKKSGDPSGGEKPEHFTKKLARVMIDAGIPSRARDRIVLPFIGKEALWLPGVRMGDRFRLSPRTRQVLEISCSPDGPEAKAEE